MRICPRVSNSLFKTAAVAITGAFLLLPGAVLGAPSGAGPAVRPNVAAGPREAQGKEDLRRLKRRLKEGDTAAVIDACEALISEDPTSAPAYCLMVKAAAAAGRQDEIEDYVRSLADRDPANPYYAYALGLCHRSRKNYLKARDAFDLALRLGADFLECPEALVDHCRYKEDLENSARILEGRPDRGFSPHVQAALGLIAFHLSDYAVARTCWEEALALFRRAGDARGEAWSLGHLSETLYYLNDYEAALRLGAQALTRAEEAGDRGVEFDALYLLSFVRLSLGRFDEALELGRRARSLCEDDCDTLRLHLADNALANVYLERGDIIRAGELLERSLAYFEETDEFFYQMKCRYWLSVVLHEKGEYVKAMEYARGALDLSRQLGFRTGDVFHLASLADICLSLGNDSKSLEYSREALAVAGGKVGKWSDEKCLNTIGFVYIKSGRNREALGYFLQALDFIRRIDHRREEPKCLYNVGYAYLRMDDLKGASEYLRQSLEASVHRGNRIIQAFCENGLAEMSLRKGETAAAVAHSSAALRLGLEMRHPGVSMDAYAGLGTAHDRAGELGLAVEAYRKAVGLIEDLRSRICFRDYSSGFFKNKIGIYEDLMSLYDRLHRRDPTAGYDKECFYYAEKARARAFLDDMETAEVHRSDGESQAAQYEIDILSHRISKIVTNLYSYDLEDGQRAALLADLDKAEEELQNAWSDYSRPAGMNPGPMGRTYRCEDVQRSLLDDATALVEYFIGKRNVFIFLVTRDRLEVTRRTAESFRPTLVQASNYRNLMSARDPTGFHGREAGARLYESLFLPLKASLPASVKRVIVVPDGELCALPFESLVSGASGSEPRFLLEDLDISYSPSASILIRIMGVAPEPRQGMDLLAVGSPVFETAKPAPGRVAPTAGARDFYMDGRFEIFPLKYARDEIRSIAKLFSGPRKLVITGADAKEETIKRLPLKDFRIIHFATHSLLDESVASRSALVLTLDSDPAEDGFFQAREIYETKLDADIVVLSACQTARGVVERGEGIMGLTRAFFCAGARSVLASLWNINDRSTREFMKRFYGYLVKGMSKEEALRRAKIRMMRSDYSHPYYWAAFILMGESGSGIPCAAPSLKDRILGVL